jgi:acetylornithine deacetylase
MRRQIKMRNRQLSVSASELVEWTQRLVRKPSPQTEQFERDPQIQDFISGTIVALLSELGLPFRRDGMGNLLVELGPESNERSLMLMAYAMTHPANRMEHPFGGERVQTANGEYVRGRGVSEQKGSLAAAIAAVKSAASGPLKGRLIFVVSAAGETGRHDAAASICESLGFIPKLAVVVIGTTGRVALGNKGRIDVIVTIQGKATHSSTPWAGINAIDGARIVLDRVMALDLSGSHHHGLGAATLTPTAIRSWPEATHTVQDEVRLVLDRRLLPGDNPSESFNAICAAANIGDPWKVSCELGPFMYPAEISRDGELLHAINAGCSRMGIAHPDTFYSNGALDAGYLCANGCEAAMWGPGDMSEWHAENESIRVEDLVEGASSYFGLIEEYLYK